MDRGLNLRNIKLVLEYNGSMFFGFQKQPGKPTIQEVLEKALSGFFNRKMKISAWDSIRNVWRPALLGTMPGVALIVAWKYLTPPASWAGLFGVVTAAAGITVVCGWFLSMDRDEHRRLLSVLRRSRRPAAVPTATTIAPVQ